MDLSHKHWKGNRSQEVSTWLTNLNYSQKKYPSPLTLLLLDKIVLLQLHNFHQFLNTHLLPLFPSLSLSLTSKPKKKRKKRLSKNIQTNLFISGEKRKGTLGGFTFSLKLPSTITFAKIPQSPTQLPFITARHPPSTSTTR